MIVRQIIYGLAIIFLIFLFCRYRNNFYLWRYLVQFCKLVETIEKCIEKAIEYCENKKNIEVVVFITIILIFLTKIIMINKFPYDLKNIKNKTGINFVSILNIDISDNVMLVIKLIFIFFFVVVGILIIIVYIYLYPCDMFKGVCKAIYEIYTKLIINLLYENMGIKVLILLSFFGANTLNWFQKFSLILPELFIEFLILIYLLYILKTFIINISNWKKFILIAGFIICFFYIVIGSQIINKSAETGIRVTKGKLKDLEDGSIELFLENNKKSFPIKIDDNKKLYIENNDSLFENYNIIKLLFNKENNLSLVTENISKQRLSPISYDEIKQGKFFFINNENSRILDRNGKKIDDKISIEGKIIIIENKSNSYIFIGNNSRWGYLDKKIEIETDNFYINILDLVLFLSSILYFWLKLYGKKSSEYYNKEIINKIKNTPILLDRNKYDKFLTLSMFGLTIPNVWKIVTTKSIGEINSSIWTKIDIVYIILFSILLFCLITSKEISEYVKELEKENEKK
jgi:hypothetical protein